ncbi:MAG: diguanylate cyclase [Gemmatimonadales bacterium]|nr:diguanylate cyclase [Gemmatimonadales bacterium]MDZ4390231.1 diguanylate cyclase [Gemmatimonadales bacterium]
MATGDTRPRKADQALATLASIGDAVITTDLSGTITYLNPVAERLTGWTAAEALGEPLDKVLPLISEANRAPIIHRVAHCLEEGRSIDLEDGVVLLRRDGSEVPVGDSAAPLVDPAGQTIGVVLVMQDESEKRRVGHRLSYEATHDVLTGLFNRREFDRRLGRIIADLRSAESEQAVVMLDLDHFKEVNDSGGHGAGDALLRQLGPLLTHQLRRHDTLARLGGDEFGILLEDCSLETAAHIAESVRRAIELLSFTFVGVAYQVTASIGLIPITSQSGGMTTVMHSVDAACYAAKAGGGNRIQRGRSLRLNVGSRHAAPESPQSKGRGKWRHPGHASLLPR